MSTRDLTTHVLDTARGRPAAGLRIDFAELTADGVAHTIRTVVTDADGRARLLADGELRVGRFEITFHVAEYFRQAGIPLSDPPFYDRIPVRFAVAEPERHYHVPLLVSPFGYVTYRGN